MERADCRAVHLPGGNFLDDIRINLEESYSVQEKWLAFTGSKKVVRRNFLINTIKLLVFGYLQRKKYLEFFVMTGLVRKWFLEFEVYWRDVLEGRSLSFADFLSLKFSYRVKFQYTNQLDWGSHDQHLKNWQEPKNIHTIFSETYKLAAHPVNGLKILRKIRPGMRILEYGCSFAPIYRSYREFFNHRRAKWVLADIPNFAFHFSRFSYAQDPDIERMVTIEADKFDTPLATVEGLFDIIVITTVFEHLHNPRHIAMYLLSKLKRNGLLVFDYIKSEAIGLDTIQGLTQRIPTLEALKANLEIIEGKLENLNESVGFCIGKKVT